MPVRPASTSTRARWEFEKPEIRERAAALGLAGCVRASFDHEELRKAMKLGEKLEPIVLFTCGRPA